MAGHRPTKGCVVNKREGGGAVGQCKIKKEIESLQQNQIF